MDPKHQMRKPSLTQRFVNSNHSFAQSHMKIGSALQRLLFPRKEKPAK